MLARVTRAPIRLGNRVEFFPDASLALRAMFDAIRGATSIILLEYYTFENVEIDGEGVLGLLLDRLAAGVRVAIVYDAIGSDHAPDSLFAELRAAGASILEYHALDPLRETFSLEIDARDHRKILLVDDRLVFLGGVNLDRQYMNPRSAGIPANGDTTRAFWQDSAVRIEGPVVADARRTFDDTWRREGGQPLGGPAADRQPLPDGEAVCIEGSAPRQGRPLHTRAMLAAIRGSRSHIWITTGYFVPMPDEIVALRRAALRGVLVRLVVPGVSDVMGAVHAGRGTYGRLLRAGVVIREMHDAVLHAKMATIDGVWSAVGSSNFDRRSARLNNEVDSVTIGHRTAAHVEQTMQDWFDRSRQVTLSAWRDRPLHERFGELTALLWKRLM